MKHDVFISHASEDKEGFVKDLAASLRNKGLSVWYDDFTLRLGDSLSESIGKGLSSSSYGVVVISPHFISKKWPKRELAALMAREDYAEKVILPVWHRVSKRDVLDHLPLLSDKLAANSTHGVEAVAQMILEVVSPGRVAEKTYRQGIELELSGDLDAATDAYIETLRVDKTHTLALRKLAGLLNRISFHAIGTKIHLGQVKWFNQSKGFGFIQEEDGKDYFVHISTLEREGVSLSDGDRVAFLAQGVRSKEMAVSIRTLPPAN